jgi:ribonuclease P protein 3
MLLRSRLASINILLVRSYAKGPYIRVRTDVFDKLVTQQPRDIQWDSVRSNLIKSEVTVNQTNVDAIIISKCFNGSHLKVALSYIDFLKANKLKINDAVIGKLIRLYYKHYANEENSLCEGDEEEVIKWCNILAAKRDIESTTAEHIIHALSVTREWQKAFKYLDEMKTLEKQPSESAYSCILVKALKEERCDIVWNLLKEMTEQNILPRVYFFVHWFDHFKNNTKKIEEMMKFISENGIMLPEVEIQRIQEALNQTYKISLVNINRTGKCPSCTQKLPGVKLLPAEFSKLASTFFDDIFVKNDAFLKSNPEELKKFQDFVNKTAPYDAVIDGLNVAYAQGDKLSPKIYAKNLSTVVKYFRDRDQKCLVIGRSHMRSWPRKDMSYIRENSLLFLAEDL